MGAIASQITSLATVYSTVYSDADQRKHQDSASLAFVRGNHRGPVNSPHKWPVTRKIFPFDDVIMFFGFQIPSSLTSLTLCGKSGHCCLEAVSRDPDKKDTFDQLSHLIDYALDEMSNVIAACVIGSAIVPLGVESSFCVAGAVACSAAHVGGAVVPTLSEQKRWRKRGGSSRCRRENRLPKQQWQRRPSKRY